MARKQLPVHPESQAGQMPEAVRGSVGFLVKQVGDLFRYRFEVVLGADGLHPRQYLLLLVLRDEGTMPQQVLGARVEMDRTTTMQAVQRLAESGLVVREDDPADRRVYRLVLTAKGRGLVDTLEARIQATEAQLLAPLSAEGRRVFKAQLEAVVSAGAARSGADSCGIEERR